jgi:hypothetical protein
VKSKTYTFAVEKACRSLKVEDRELWTLTVRLKHLPRGLQYGPNARHATLSSRPAKDMLATAEQNPESFVFKNNGIMVVAQSIRVDNSLVVMACQEAESDDDDNFLGHGVLNGGHTYKVLQEVLDRALEGNAKFEAAIEEISVLLTVAIGIPEEDISQISRARNTSEKVPLHAIRDLAGDWSSLKAEIKNLTPAQRALIALKVNDEEAPEATYDITDLVRRLALLNNTMFPAQAGKHPVQAYTGITSLVKKYKPEDFALLATLLPDALRLEELTVRHWQSVNGKGAGKLASMAQVSGCSKEPKQLLSGYKADLSIADPFVLPVIAAFRVFIKDGKWVKPLDQLWESFGPKTVEALWEAYKEGGRSSAAFFGRAKASWTAACDLTKSAAIQMQVISVDGA